jgi:predicted ABC-type ATPase
VPNLYIITGSNGAGKSSIGPDYLPYDIRNNNIVFDGDLLYTKKLKELFPAKTKSPKYARKDALEYVVDLFEHQREEALATMSDYVYEGHFTNDETWTTPKRFKEAGYTTHLIFLGLANPYESQLRVTERVTTGGHYVERNTIEANFYGNLEKLNIYYSLIDNLTIIDTSNVTHKILFNAKD